MYARVRELLTPEERLQYLQIPPNLGEWELGTYFTFTQHDLEIIQQRRRDYNRLGFAVQLCVLRYLGWTLSDVKEVPIQVLCYIAKQINADVESFASYGEREATKYEHLEEIRKEYGFQTFTLSEYRSLCKHLFNHAMANGNPLHLIQLDSKSYASVKSYCLQWPRLKEQFGRLANEQKKKYSGCSVARLQKYRLLSWIES
ncbi:hypothetical protein BCE02nite_39560 [Brevibacillus centrosporus]|nr:hypothetical protein BCE02nite_39560 [Brevibacillus centrosporus]